MQSSSPTLFVTGPLSLATRLHEFESDLAPVPTETLCQRHLEISSLFPLLRSRSAGLDKRADNSALLVYALVLDGKTPGRLRHVTCKPGPRNGGGGPQTMSFVERLHKRECAKRELSDYTPQGREKIHRNNFRVSLPRCRAVRSWVGVCSFRVRCFRG